MVCCPMCDRALMNHSVQEMVECTLFEPQEDGTMQVSDLYLRTVGERR